MLTLIYCNVGNVKAFKKAMFMLSTKLSANGFNSSVGFNDKSSVAFLHLNNFTNAGILPAMLTNINSMLSLIALDIEKFEVENIYPDIVKFGKNI